MIARFQHNARCALHRLRGEKSGYVARQAHLHAAFGQRFQNDVRKRGAARGETRHGVHVLFVEHNGTANGVEHAPSDFEIARRRMSASANRCHAAADRGWRIWHRSNDRHLIMLATSGRGELLLDETCRHRSRNGNKQRLRANFGSDLLQHFRHRLGFYRQQNDIGASNHFPIVCGHGDAQLFRKRGCSLRMLDRSGEAVRYKEPLLQVSPQQNATQLTCAEHG